MTENHRIDPQYEELDEAFEYDDRYIAPLVTYLTYSKASSDVYKRQMMSSCWRSGIRLAFR